MPLKVGNGYALRAIRYTDAFIEEKRQYAEAQIEARAWTEAEAAEWFATQDTLNVEFAKFVRDRLPYLDYEETLAWYAAVDPTLDRLHRAFLACNDRYYLLLYFLGREDLKHIWLFDRCREVDANPDGHVDLWARFHGKSSIITYGGIIQEILCEPEITICIFSVTKPIAREFLAQIKNEFETNEKLKSTFADVLYREPNKRTGKDGRPAKWGLERGITVKRKGRPKEATLEAHGLIDGQPVGRHFHMHVYDDIVTQDNLTEEQLKKTTARFEMADNLGTRQGVRKWIAGTRYHFADAYGVILEKGSAKPRIYPATEDATLNGPLVLLTPEHWTKIKRDQGQKIVSAQMLLNPLAGNEATFLPTWLRGYEIVPRIMNVYILVDPSKGSGQRSDRTAIPVIGIDVGGNKYLLDGVCHRMRLSERLRYVENFKAYWESFPGVQSVKVGWERYGKDVELEVVEDILRAKNNLFTIEELNTPRQGGHSKNDRIERLEPDLRGGRFYLPAVVHHFEHGDKVGPFAGMCLWRVWDEQDVKNAERLKQASTYHLGQILYRPMRGYTKLQREHAEQQKSRIVLPLKRRNESNEFYDLTRVFMDEMIRHPFAPHDDLIDAVSRIYDIEPLPPVQYDAKDTESLDVDNRGIDPGSPGDFD